MVFRQAIDMVLHCVKGCRCQHACLTHAAAKHFAVPHRFGDQISWSGQRRSDRRAQPLAEANAYRVRSVLPNERPRCQ